MTENQIFAAILSTLLSGGTALGVVKLYMKNEALEATKEKFAEVQKNIDDFKIFQEKKCSEHKSDGLVFFKEIKDSQIRQESKFDELKDLIIKELFNRK